MVVVVVEGWVEILSGDGKSVILRTLPIFHIPCRIAFPSLAILPLLLYAHIA